MVMYLILSSILISILTFLIAFLGIVIFKGKIEISAFEDSGMNEIVETDVNMADYKLNPLKNKGETSYLLMSIIKQKMKIHLVLMLKKVLIWYSTILALIAGLFAGFILWIIKIH